MIYKTYTPHDDLASLVKCYWTLEVAPDANAAKQRIIPDGCIEMAFILGDDIRRYTSDVDFILQPRAMVLGQTMAPFYIQPTGTVNTFAVSFFPHGFANFISEPLKNLRNTETPLASLFGPQEAEALDTRIMQATDTEERIRIIEAFLFSRLSARDTIDQVVQSTIDLLFASRGNVTLSRVLKQDAAQRRRLERKFLTQIGISPKQLCRVIRMQAALKLLLSDEADTLTNIAYKSAYYDQSHFIKDFKDFAGVSPGEFLGERSMALSTLFYRGSET